jgi:hypothetical protein
MSKSGRTSLLQNSLRRTQYAWLSFAVSHPSRHSDGQGIRFRLKSGILGLKTGLLGLKSGQKTGFAVTNQLTGENRILLIPCELQAFNCLQNAQKEFFHFQTVSGDCFVPCGAGAFASYFHCARRMGNTMQAPIDYALRRLCGTADAMVRLTRNKRRPGGQRYSRPGGRRYRFVPRGST